MKKIINNPLVIAGLSLIIGLGLGYFLFKGNSAHMHESMSISDANTGVWTCSMHPQIRQNEPGLCPLCNMDLIPATASESSDPTVLKMTPEAVKLANIETTIIGSETVSGKEMMLSGKVKIDERLAASQVAHIPGRIEQLFVSFEGEAVRRGQKVATLYSPELITAQQELLQAIKLKASNPELVEAARKKLAYWKIGTEQIAEIEANGKVQETFVLRADASGIVKQRRVAVGDHIMQGGVLFDLIGLNRVWVVFDAYEEDLAKIKLGDEIGFTTPAIPNQTFTTRINFIDPVIDPQTRVAAIRGEVSNAKGLLKPEMFLRGSLSSKTATQAQLLIPRSAVLWTGQRSVVYLKVSGADIPSFRFQEIELGERIGENYAVLRGLKAGDQVVSQGSFSIDAAAQLNNMRSMMNQVVDIKEEKNQGIQDFSGNTSSDFSSQLAALTDRYFTLKDALVATDSKEAQAAATAFLDQLKQIDMKPLEGDAHDFWMEQSTVLQSAGNEMLQSDEIETIRTHFKTLSDSMIKTLQSLGQGDDPVYVQFCPMAFDNQGADWLSREENVLNPYFGDRMLRCGSVKDVLE